MTAWVDDAPHDRCGCTGVRWCAKCLDPEARRLRRMDPPVRLPDFISTRPEDSASPSKQIHRFDLDLQCAPSCPEFHGIFVFRDFYSEDEADLLLEEIEKSPFLLAQSGKQKQHYGPKVNFNKRKLNFAKFQGLPNYVSTIETRLKDVLHNQGTTQCSATARAALTAATRGFESTDVFVLRYLESDQSNLDFHQDDTFAYGETILDLSLESDSVLTFLDAPQVDTKSGRTNCIRVPLPARSMAVLFGAARFDWEHAILPFDIEKQRTSITFRTLSDELRASGDGEQILRIARGDAGTA